MTHSLSRAPPWRAARPGPDTALETALASETALLPDALPFRGALENPALAQPDYVNEFRDNAIGQDWQDPATQLLREAQTSNRGDVPLHARLSVRRQACLSLRAWCRSATWHESALATNMADTASPESMLLAVASQFRAAYAQGAGSDGLRLLRK